jgi:hypothetical protein
MIAGVNKESTMAKCYVDYCWDANIQATLKDIEQHDAKIAGHQAVGPAGGNPCLLLEFKSSESALHFLMERYSDDGEEFCKSRIF